MIHWHNSSFLPIAPVMFLDSSFLVFHWLLSLSASFRCSFFTFLNLSLFPCSWTLRFSYLLTSILHPSFVSLLRPFVSHISLTSVLQRLLLLLVLHFLNSLHFPMHLYLLFFHIYWLLSFIFSSCRFVSHISLTSILQRLLQLLFYHFLKPLELACRSLPHAPTPPSRRFPCAVLDLRFSSPATSPHNSLQLSPPSFSFPHFGL